MMQVDEAKMMQGQGGGNQATCPPCSRSATVVEVGRRWPRLVRS
jgi:hypothetical protein